MVAGSFDMIRDRLQDVWAFFKILESFRFSVQRFLVDIGAMDCKIVTYRKELP